jgi:hypothetical protein
MADLSSLYPQPPAPAQGSILTQNPLQLLGPMMDVAKFRAQQSVGEAAQDAIKGDGTFDPQAFMAGVKSRGSAASLAAPGAVQGALDAWGKNIQNGQNAFDYNVKKSNTFMGQAVPYATKPGGLTDNDVPQLQAWWVRSGLPADTATDIGNWLLSVKDPIARQRLLSGFGVGMAGPGAFVTPGPATVDQSTGIVRQPSAAETAPGGSARGGPGAALPGGGAGAAPATSLPPMTGANSKQYQDDLSASGGLVSNLRPLQAALPLVRALSHWSFGKSASDIARARSFIQTLGISDKGTDPQLQVQQELAKYLAQYRSGQPAGTDLARVNSELSNPNMDLTKEANEELIMSQIGRDRVAAATPYGYDAVDAARRPQGAPADQLKSGYLAYRPRHFAITDQKAAEFDIMTPEQRSAYLKTLGPKTSPAYQRFIATLSLMRRNNIMPEPGQ